MCLPAEQSASLPALQAKSAIQRGHHRPERRVDKEERMTLHNHRHTADLDEIARQFAENDTYRKQRKCSVVMYHEILSFHALDRVAITLDVLERVVMRAARLI